MIVILNRFAPDRSTAFLTNYAYYSSQATQGGLATGAAACGVVPPKGKRSTEEESKACTAVAPVPPALDAGSADRSATVDVVGQDGSLQGYWLKYVSGQGGHGWSDRGNNGIPLLSNGAPSIGFGGSHSDSSSYVDTHVVDEKGTAQLLSAPNNEPEKKWYDYPGAKLASQVVIEEPTGAGGGRWWGVSEDGNLVTSYDHKKWDSVNHG
ncbi:hypothetical protein [Streptomyces caniferus]|uniref:hypothetical protein n=1 Tax=Streptomyces caniferus TaxID=285557 RepID=UPI0037F9472A